MHCFIYSVVCVYRILWFAMLTQMCECRDSSMDVKTPRNVYLSAFYKRSFAYHSVKHREPVILTSTIDNLVRNKDEIIKGNGEGAREDLKKVIGEISKFKYEIQTNKPLQLLITNNSDVHYYNEYISKQETEEGHTTHFNTIWLLTECYMYRRLKEIFMLTDTLKNFDYFQTTKREAYQKAIPLMTTLAEFLSEIECNNIGHIKKEFIAMLKLNLWGNKCDLSVSLGKVNGPEDLTDTSLRESMILSDDSEKVWEAASLKNENDLIDIVLDNSGYELFTDCCLADFLIEHQLAKKIRFYVKTIPWFISDVMTHDFHWTVNELQESSNDCLRKMGYKWKDYLDKKVWEIVEDSFWTLPFEYKYMKTIAPNLYKKLSEAKLIFFKGDLNYRKLFGEINWDPTTSVEEALQGFHPAKLATLRTIKAHIVVGLPPGVAEECEKNNAKWNEEGDFGLIQFCDKIITN